MERPEEVTRFLRCGGMNCDRSCENGGKVEDCLTWRVHGYVEELEAQVPKWISVEERLPEHDVFVLVGYKRFGFVFEGCFDEEEKQWCDREYSCIAPPSHWMPLPEPPKEE